MMNKKLYSLVLAAAAVLVVCNSKAEAYVSVGVDWVSQCAPAIPYAPSVSAGVSYDGAYVNGYVNAGCAGGAYVCPPPMPPHHGCRPVPHHPQPRRHGHHHRPQPCPPPHCHHGGHRR